MPTLMEGTNPIAGLIPDRGSVSVTADGTKTYSQLFDTLYEQIDISKVTDKTILIIGITGDINVFAIEAIGNDLIFSRSIASTTNIAIRSVTIKSSGSTYLSASINNTPAFNVTDYSAMSPVAGLKFTINY